MSWQEALIRCGVGFLVLFVVWRLLAAWSRHYLRRHLREQMRINRADPRCERAGSQGEFYRRLHARGGRR